MGANTTAPPLFASIAQLEDPRTERAQRHKLRDILTSVRAGNDLRRGPCRGG